mmetsp:Transcript_92564/g.258778  ORF Transcript_92564/g.258778 Transcript_92564/m.258778 type:complete len:284 (+) Transcript_92564:67-918(+)
MLKCCCIDRCAGTVAATMTDEEWAAWEAGAKSPEVYDPPQKRSFNDCINCPLRFPCPCCVPCVRGCCCYSLGSRRVSLHQPDEWFAEMLRQKHPNCPEEFTGIWWMKDNTAAEGLLTLQDGAWETPKLMRKSAKYNWTVDACNLWGAILTANFWVRGGNHTFSRSLSGKWLQIAVVGSAANFIYVVQPGDVVKHKDGTPLDLTPGEDMIRISYEDLKGQKASFQYLARRVAYLDGSGALVKTKYYDELVEVARNSDKCCRGRVEHHIDSSQEFTPAPEQQSMA